MGMRDENKYFCDENEEKMFGLLVMVERALMNPSMWTWIQGPFVQAGLKPQLRLFLTTSLPVDMVDLLPSFLQRSASLQKNLQCLATLQSMAVSPHFTRTKASELSNSTHLEPNREALLFSIAPPLLHRPIFLLCWLGSKRGIFYFGFSAGGQSSQGCGFRGDITTLPPKRAPLREPAPFFIFL